MTLLLMGCQHGSSPGADPRDDDSAGGTTASSTGGSNAGGSSGADGDEAKTVCQRFCDVAYMCPDGVQCADESCHDFEYCESSCEEQRALVAESGCEELIDVFYNCASQQTGACEAEDPTRAFNLPCSEELNDVFDCYNESEIP